MAITQLWSLRVFYRLLLSTLWWVKIQCFTLWSELSFYSCAWNDGWIILAYHRSALFFLTVCHRQLNWNRQHILYLQHNSKLLGLDTSVCYTLEANARQLRGTEQSNVSACWRLDTRVDFHFMEGFSEKRLLDTREDWLVAFVLQDPDSEAGSLETDISKVKLSCCSGHSFALVVATSDVCVPHRSDQGAQWTVLRSRCFWTAKGTFFLQQPPPPQTLSCIWTHSPGVCVRMCESTRTCKCFGCSSVCFC